MQRNCIFPGRYEPLTYYEDVSVRHQNGFLHIVMVWYVVLKIGTR